jgi:hypothetical protein
VTVLEIPKIATSGALMMGDFYYSNVLVAGYCPMLTMTTQHAYTYSSGKSGGTYDGIARVDCSNRGRAIGRKQLVLICQ